MKNRKAQILRLHTGITAIQQVLSSIHFERHKAEMLVTPTGVHVTFPNGEEHFVYSGNIIDCILLPDEKGK